MPITSPTVRFVFTAIVAQGDMLDLQFTDHKVALDSVIAAINDIRRTDGALKNGIVTSDSLAPGLLTTLTTAFQAAIAADAASADAAKTIAVTAKDDAVTAKNAAQTSAASALASATAVAGGAGTALANAIAAANTITAAANAVAVSVTDAENAENDAEGAAALAQEWAEVSVAWAEHMPDTIPPNILATMGVTGDHWSSRWWANRAALDATQVAIDADRASNAALSAEADADRSENAADASEAAYDEFSTHYLGEFATPPVADNDGNGLTTGALYFNTTLNQMFVWNGTTWQGFAGASTAVSVSFVPTGSVSSTNVQAAIAEVASEYASADTATLNSAKSYADTQDAGLQAQIDTAQDTADASVKKAGDTMTGLLLLSGAPTAPLHAATKLYVDAVDTNADSRVSKAGDTMSGALTIQMSWPAIYLRKSNAAESNQLFGYSFGGSLRWIARLGEDAADNFALLRYNDAGTLIDRPLIIDRATGVLATTKRPVFNGGLAWDYLNFPMDITTVPPTPGDAPVWDGTKFVPGLSGGAVVSSTPPTFKPGSLWWNKDNGSLFVAYADGNSNQWVSTTPVVDPSVYLLKGDNLQGLGNTDTSMSNLGMTSVGIAVAKAASPAAARAAIGLLWTPVSVARPTSPVAAIDMAIPANCNSIRFGGCVVLPTGSILYAALSFDGGATYLTGATDYIYSYFYQNGAALTGVGTTSSSAFPMVASVSNAFLLKGPIDAQMSLGGGGFVTRYKAQSSGLATDLNSVLYHGYSASTVRPTHIRFYPSGGGNIGVGTEIIMEASNG
jgi:hypothetical protein